MDAKENWPSSEAVSIETLGLRPAHRRAVHVCLALAYRLFTKPGHEPLIPTFTNHLVTTNFWETFPSVGVAIPFLFICGFVTVYFWGKKDFALMPARMAVSSVSPTNSRREKSGLRLRAINAGIAPPPARRTWWSMRR